MYFQIISNNRNTSTLTGLGYSLPFTVRRTGRTTVRFYSDGSVVDDGYLAEVYGNKFCFLTYSFFKKRATLKV